MRSLFEEQIVREQLGAAMHLGAHDNASAEALSYTPPTSVFALGPDTYLEQLRRIRAAVSVPVRLRPMGACCNPPGAVSVNAPRKSRPRLLHIISSELFANEGITTA